LEGSDEVFYLSIIDEVTQKFEIANEFFKVNGFQSLPSEELFDIIVDSIKIWLVGKEGELWLSTLGYERTMISGVLNYNLIKCPVCGQDYNEMNSTTCERCGKSVCNSCINVVDEVYHIGWCTTCLGKSSLK